MTEVLPCARPPGKVLRMNTRLWPFENSKLTSDQLGPSLWGWGSSARIFTRSSGELRLSTAGVDGAGKTLSEWEAGGFAGVR